MVLQSATTTHCGILLKFDNQLLPKQLVYFGQSKSPAGDFAPTGLVCYTIPAFGAHTTDAMPWTAAKSQGFLLLLFYIILALCQMLRYQVSTIDEP